MFDADAYVKSLVPPSVKIDGEVYVGKLLGFDEVAKLQERFAALDEGATELDGVAVLAGDLCRALELPSEKILALPIPAMMAACADFLRSLITETKQPAVDQGAK